MKKLFAFTLAETLVVIGIIGVVSALTLPNLNASTGDKENIAKVKKAYRDLDQALGMAKVKYGSYNTWFNDVSGTAYTTRFAQRMTEFMKVTKTCGLNANQGCFSKSNVIFSNGTKGSTFDAQTTYYKFILSDGMSAAFYNNHIFIDIDGPNKGPNKYGYDIFLFIVENQSIVPRRADTFANYLSGSTAVNNGGHFASGWVIDYDNMDYKKMLAGKCKTTPTETNPRCN